jgi:hypothetical protein
MNSTPTFVKRRSTQAARLGVLTLFLAAAPALAQTSASAEDPLAPLAWLDGCWRGTVNQREFREHWMPLRGGLLLGMSQTVMGGKSQGYEYLRIESRPDGIYYVAQPGDNAYLLPMIGVYDYFAIDWGYRVIPDAQSCADQWPELDRLAARQIDDPALRFGGENDAADVDSTVNTQVLGSDPIEATDMGLRNIDRVAPMLIPATTDLGRPYTQLSEVYTALLVKRQKELLSVAKMVGGVEEVRYHAGRGTVPFSPVPAARQRKAVKFLIDRGFTRPDALLDPQLLWRMVPYGGPDPVQDTNQKLLAQLINKDVFHRMAEAATFPGAAGTFQGTDMLLDLNDGLFSELKRARPDDRHHPRSRCLDRPPLNGRRGLGRHRTQRP